MLFPIPLGPAGRAGCQQEQNVPIISVTCDDCGRPVAGPCYRHLQFFEYKLCSSCQAKGPYQSGNTTRNYYSKAVEQDKTDGQNMAAHGGETGTTTLKYKSKSCPFNAIVNKTSIH